MTHSPPDPERRSLPQLPAFLLRRLLPTAEREEVLEQLAVEYRARASESGEREARRWVWWQVLSSAPALVRRGWWRGWSGFETRSEGLSPGGAMLESWGQDVRFALRRLRRRPGYTAVVVMTLALGVAGTAAAFGIVRTLLLDPLPVAAEEEVVVFWAPGGWSEEEFAYLRPEMTGFRNVAAFRHSDVTLQVGDAPARLVRGYSATAELFETLGARPAMGPGFRRGDDALGTEPVAVLSHSLWRDLGADRDIVGERLELGGEMRTIVGVMPRGFWFPSPQVQVWLAEELDPDNAVGNYALIGRMDDGLTVAGMGPHLDRIATLLDNRFDYPEQWDLSANPELTPLREDLMGSLRPAVLATLGAMGAILLIACVNVAMLMMGQVDSRGTELAVRGALGAGRRRLLQQVVVESLVVGGLAGLIGAALSVVGFRFLVAALPLGELADAAAIDWTLFGMAMAVALLAATAVGLAPGVTVARSDLRSRLTRSRTGGVRHEGMLENGLVVAQVALVLLLVSGAALLVRSVDNLRGIETGVEEADVAVLDFVIPTTTTGSERGQVTREIVDAMRGVPGVEAAAATQRLPLRGSSDNWGITVEGRPDLPSTTTAFRVVTPDYFETMGIRVLSGRGLDETDRNPEAEEGAVVINRALADKYFEGVDPLGRRIAFMGGRWDRIVGVVENVAENDLSPDAVPARYMVYDQVPWLLPLQTLVLRAGGGRDLAAILDDARAAVHTVAPGVAIRETTTMKNVLDRAIGPALQVMALLSLLGGLALTLGVTGVYGVVSHFVTRRKRDWGIRIALGMRPLAVVRGIVARGGALVAGGVIIGAIAFLALARLAGSLLYGVEPTDAVSLAGATGVMLAAGLLAALVPALRAARIDPVNVLREE